MTHQIKIKLMAQCIGHILQPRPRRFSNLSLVGVQLARGGLLEGDECLYFRGMPFVIPQGRQLGGLLISVPGCASKEKGEGARR